jgi:hypothetical protein
VLCNCFGELNRRVVVVQLLTRIKVERSSGHVP